MRDFKFFQKEERVFTQWMDEMDDYHLGGIRHAVESPAPQLKPFTLNLFVEVVGRIPTFLFAIEQSNVDEYETIRGTTLGHLTNGHLGIPWCFTSVTITRTDNSSVTITYDNVDEMDRMGLIFNPEDTVTISYKQ
jgi:hypothetical protein